MQSGRFQFKSLKSVGWLLAFGSVIFYSINSPIARGALRSGMDPTTLLAARFVLGSLLFAVSLPLITHFGKKNRAPRQPIHGRGLLICLFSGLANGLTLLFLYRGLVTLEASLSSVIMIGLMAIFTLGLLRLWGNRPRIIDLARLVISMVGLILLLGPGGVNSWVGVAFTVGAAFFFAVHVVTVQLYLKEYSVWTVTALIVASATVLAVFLWWQAGAPTFVPGVAGWLAIIFQAVIATFLGRLMTYGAIILIGSDQFALLSPLETMLTILWSVVFLGEVMAGWQVIGAAAIVAATALQAVPWGRMGMGRLLRPIVLGFAAEPPPPENDGNQIKVR